MDRVKLLAVESELKRKYPKCRHIIKDYADRLGELGDEQVSTDDELLRDFEDHVARLRCAQPRRRSKNGGNKRGGSR